MAGTKLLFALLAVVTLAQVCSAFSSPLKYSKLETEADGCECVVLDDLPLFQTVCGPPAMSLKAGQTYRRAAGTPVNACGGLWIPLMVGDGSVGWTRSPEVVGLCDCRQQPLLPRASLNGGPSALLIRCLCIVESNCNANIGCRWDVGSDSCGPYQIKQAYWSDASSFAKKKLGGDWKTCTTGPNNMACSVEAIKYYMARYGKRCVGPTAEPTDEDYARIHNGGPKGCKSAKTLDYWTKVQACMKKL